MPAGDPDGGQWTTGWGAAQRNELTPEQVARLRWAYLPYGGNAGATDAAYAGQRIDPGTAGLYHDRTRMYAPLSPDRPAGSGDDASIYLLPLTDVDTEYGWTPEPDYVAVRGRGGPRYSPVEQLRVDLYNQALRNVRRFDPGFREVSNPNSVPLGAAIARLRAEAVGLARTHSYFETRGISLAPHALRSISDRPNRGVSPETALHAYNTGRVFYDPPSGYFIRRDSQTGAFVVVTSRTGGQIISAAEVMSNGDGPLSPTGETWHQNSTLNVTRGLLEKRGHSSSDSTMIFSLARLLRLSAVLREA